MLALVLASALDLSGIDRPTVALNAAAVMFDGYTTQRSLALNGYKGWRVEEGNPLPGMKVTPLRFAYGAAEIYGVAKLSQKSRKWGRIVGWSLAAVHIFCGVSNIRSANHIRNY